MDTRENISQLQQFREELYWLLPARRDALLDLLDALSGSPYAHSVVELSLSPLFRREYSSISDAIDHVFQPSSPEKADEERWVWKKELARLIGRCLPAPRHRQFWLLGTDGVPIPRPFALRVYRKNRGAPSEGKTRGAVKPRRYAVSCQQPGL